MISKSIAAGMSISIASYIYLQIGGLAGALLFSIGLLVILNLKLKLFTGTIGYINSRKDLKDNLIILTGNAIGTLFILLFPYPMAYSMVATKLAAAPLILFAKSFVCGMFIYAAVESFKREKDYMVPVCVSGFILFGGEHCIADLAYILAAQMWSPQVTPFLIIVILGNSIGAIVLRRIHND